MARFDDAVVIITGASEGIGKALALELARDRPRLVLAARNEARLAEVADECRVRGARTLVVPTDVADAEQCRALVERTSSEHGRLDMLVANAGATMWARFDEVQDLAMFERLMRVNYLGAVYLTHHALGALQASQGRIVAVASVAGLTGVPCRTGYAASKHAMVGFFESLRIEIAESGVSVTIVAPDFVRSEIHRRALDAAGQPLGTSPLQEKHVMTAERCAEIIANAAERRARLVVTSARGKAGRVLKLFAPSLVDRMAARAIRRAR